MSIQHQLSQSASLLSAVDAVRNWRAAGLMLASFVLAGLLFALGGVLAQQVHPALGAVFFLCSIASIFYGANAAGIMLIDEARGGQSRTVLAAVLTSLSTGHRLILVMLMVGLIYVVGVLVIALLLFVCKVPGVGPLLFAFVFPLTVVVSGVAIFSLYAVITPLAAPAIWSGATALQALLRLAAIARQRIVAVILSMIVLLFICVVVGGIIAGIMMTGTWVAGSLSAGILGVGGMDMNNLMHIGNSNFGFSENGSSGHLAAGAFGGGIVWAIAFTLPALVYLRGSCQVYLSSIQGVNVDGMEQQLRGGLEAARRKAESIKAKGEALAAQPAQRFENQANPAPVLVAVAGPQCPACHVPYVPGDLFCGSCGHSLA